MFQLKELTEEMIDEIYDMYQDIPDKENGQTNEAYGLSKEEFKVFIKKEINRKNNEITYDDTPTITYIMYVNNLPVGYICLRTKIDDNWKIWSGNIYYKVRQSERKKGYATKMLELLLEKIKNMDYKEVFINSSKGNIGSQKVIENNGGIFLEEKNGSRYYKINV